MIFDFEFFDLEVEVRKEIEIEKNFEEMFKVRQRVVVFLSLVLNLRVRFKRKVSMLFMVQSKRVNLCRFFFKRIFVGVNKGLDFLVIFKLVKGQFFQKRKRGKYDICRLLNEQLVIIVIFKYYCCLIIMNCFLIVLVRSLLEMLVFFFICLSVKFEEVLIQIIDENEEVGKIVRYFKSLFIKS